MPVHDDLSRLSPGGSFPKVVGPEFLAFQDDPGRLLRAVRIEAELGFEIAPRTVAWIRRDAALLAAPAAERVRDEFVRLLALRGAALHLQRLDEFGLLTHVVLELESLKRVTQ